MNLRWYQTECLESIWNNLDRNVVACLPTGSGKSHVLAEFCKRAVQTWPDTRICVLAHVKELLEQNAEKILMHWPDAPVSLWCAGLNSKEANNITVASIQSIYKKTHETGPYEVLLVDECHLINPHAESMYKRFISEQMVLNPLLKVAGLTATPYRMKTGQLHEGENALFDDLVYECKLTPLISEGWLSPIIGKNGAVQANTQDMHIRAGEFKSDEMQDEFQSMVIESCSDIMKNSQDRKSILIFTAGIDHAYVVYQYIKALDEKVEIVTGETPKKERTETVERFKNCDIRILVNCSVYTTGFDAPNVDCIALLRCTRSPGLYVQMVGRGLRVAPGKKDCLVLDYGGNIRRHGPLEDVTSDRQISEKIARSKTCPSCGNEIALAANVCTICGYQFPQKKREIRHDIEADNADPMSKQIDTHKVYRVEYSRHRKAGKPDSMRVIYYCNENKLFPLSFSEYICLEHGGYAADKARHWAIRRGINPPPDTITESLLMKYIEPTAITVKKDGKYWAVINYDFTKDGQL